MPVRTISMLTRAQLQPGTITSPGIGPDVNERGFLARLDPDQDYPTTAWSLVVERSFDGGATYHHWLGTEGTGIVRGDRGGYAAIGGEWPDGDKPSHVRVVLALAARTRIGIQGETV